MVTEIDQQTVRRFQKMVMGWWEENARDLPWRRNPSPYNVLVSEVMLQQTQVSRVVPKYKEFLDEFPDFESLASADTKKLLTVWSGLGYNRRALWLRDAAQQIMECGSLPRTAEELCELKGIGPYTSRSVLIFTFNKDLAAVDTNIRRVLIASGLATEEMSMSELQMIADQVLLKGRSRDWHNALMDYGAIVLTSSSTGISPKTTQSRFEGSTRQIRGAVVRLLTEKESLSVAEIVTEAGIKDVDESDVAQVIEQLVQEKMVSCTRGDRYKIAG